MAFNELAALFADSFRFCILAGSNAQLPSVQHCYLLFNSFILHAAARRNPEGSGEGVKSQQQ